ncbi:hypothetical protein [Paraburkholderia lacunae]|uniref:Uncharacterized protein n=1 Tax=Paraburkholderia lacunae TaxID=2211104 RepID=A0A370NCQ9_9BURK|nr:hypothetical protein [Paraburkholderia lacunae]RDK03382.1 hypothetical protein DLM46_07575 [Paraburkholderia lacunae]
MTKPGAHLLHAAFGWRVTIPIVQCRTGAGLALFYEGFPPIIEAAAGWQKHSSAAENGIDKKALAADKFDC